MKKALCIMGLLLLVAIGLSVIEDEWGISNNVEQIRYATVIITDGEGHGSGIYLGEGIILTAGHCVDVNNTFIKDYKGNVYKILKKIKCSDPNEDIGFLIIDSNVPIVSIKKVAKQTPDIGSKVFICGTPLKLYLLNTFTTGTVINKHIDIEDWWYNVIISDAAGYQGDSGGGVYNKNYELIGIFVGLHSGCDNLSIIEPIEDILKQMKKEL